MRIIKINEFLLCHRSRERVVDSGHTHTQRLVAPSNYFNVTWLWRTATDRRDDCSPIISIEKSQKESSIFGAQPTVN